MMGVDLCGWCAFVLPAHLTRLAPASGADGRRRVLRSRSRTPPTAPSPRTPRSSSTGVWSSRGLLCATWVVPPRRDAEEFTGELGGVGVHWGGLNLAFFLLSLPSNQPAVQVSFLLVPHGRGPYSYSLLSLSRSLRSRSALRRHIAGEDRLPEAQITVFLSVGKGKVWSRSSGGGFQIVPAQRRIWHRGRTGDSGSGIWVASVESCTRGSSRALSKSADDRNLLWEGKLSDPAPVRTTSRESTPLAAVFDLHGPRLPLVADLLVRRASGRGPEPSGLRTRRTTGSRSMNSMRQMSCRAAPPWHEYAPRRRTQWNRRAHLADCLRAVLAKRARR